MQAGGLRRQAQLCADRGRRTAHLGLQPSPPVRRALPVRRQHPDADPCTLSGRPQSDLRGGRAPPHHSVHRCRCAARAVTITEHHSIFNCDAYQTIRCSQKFRPLFADLETKTLHAVYHKNDYPLIAKLLLQCRGERTKVIK